MIVRTLQVVTALIVVLALVSWLMQPQDASLRPRETSSPEPSTAATAVAVATPSIGVASPSPLPPIEMLRLTVPELGIDLPLAYGDVARDVPQGRFEGNTPERFAFVFPGTAPLGSGGNTYIYAHARVGMFLALWNVHLNDAVMIYAPERPEIRLRYTVARIVPRVDPSDTSWLDPLGPERVTLQTSTGPNAADPRFIAVAVRESVAPTGSAKP